MSRVIVTREKLVAVADAVREKTETSDALTLDEMPSAISGIKTGGDIKAFVKSLCEKTLTECDNEAITKVGDYAFYDIRTLTVLNIPNVESIGASAFMRCTGIKAIDLPKCKTIGSSAFASCNGVRSINVPVLESVQTGTFNSCTFATEINCPMVKSIANQGFYYASGLSRFDFLQLESIATHAFNQTKTATLIIRTPSVCSLANTNAFLNSPIVRGEGYIYVPKSLVESYKSATNWATYANQIRAIEDYPEVTGGL